jgi:integrase
MTAVDSTSILSRSEIQQVLADLKRRVYRRHKTVKSWSAFINLIVFRLSCCCGLRRQEIRGINLKDVLVESSKPIIVIRKEISKGRDGQRKARKVPLWWDAGTLADLKQYKATRKGSPEDPFVVGVRTGRLSLHAVNDRWRSAIRCLGPERVGQLSIHKGRHSFCSHYLFIGRSLAEVAAAAGHKNLSTTSLYAHLIEREDVGDGFSFKEKT